MTLLSAILIYGMALFYVAAGINHFIQPKFYIGIMPDFFPAKKFLNRLSGLAEIILGILLVFPVSRKISAGLIIAMLLSFFSVHITHLFVPPSLAKDKYWLLIIRIPLQFILIGWAWKVSKL